MTSNAIIQARIDAKLKKQAAAVLENIGLTVSDAIRILITRVAKEGALPLDFVSDPEIHDAWFRAKVREALEDRRAPLAHKEVEAHFAKRRKSLQRTAK